MTEGEALAEALEVARMLRASAANEDRAGR